VPAADVWSFGIVLVTVLIVATVASGAPAWRSSAGDPTDVLRA
jgi:ABC-type lipoprotein release transport system permease subunit